MEHKNKTQMQSSVIQNETDFSERYFMEELLRFREAMGNKSVMTNESKRESALRGFGTVYLQTKTTNQERIASLFDATVMEFNRRCFYVDMLVN